MRLGRRRVFLARFQRDWHQPPRRDCHRKSRTAMSRVQYPKGIAPWVAYRKGHFNDLPWPTNGGMPFGVFRPTTAMAWQGSRTVCATPGLRHEAGPAESASGDALPHTPGAQPHCQRDACQRQLARGQLGHRIPQQRRHQA